VLLPRPLAAISHQSNLADLVDRETALTIAVVIVAAGRGSRAAGSSAGLTNQPGLPKQFVRLAGEMVLTRTLRAFAEHPAGCPLLQVVIGADDRELFDEATKDGFPKLLLPVVGGATRQASVLAGLEALMPHQPGRVLIHDAARPFVSAAVIDRVLAGLTRTPGAIAALPVADTIKRSDINGEISATVDRNGHWLAQTPQGFHFPAILAAHRQAQTAARQSFTDDAAIAEWAGLAVSLVQGSAKNIKLTTQEDMILAEETLSRITPPSGLPDVRTGTGFDVHKFAPGDAVWLCGVKIPFAQKLDGHSDADVGLHALTDAILGALGDGDIGSHFPPSDMQWKGAASHLFLTHARSLVEAKGARISNVDVTIMCEMPKVGPHRDSMRKAIADILRIDIGRVGVKATTTEGLGFTGRREGIAAMASATLVLPGTI
jgi:2-C-methyl-D-erythritol 4-phosphate cytidylyltransferase / 2-C-methyl-D-erythritol 2,4-cyclodiphosphate synthase